MSADLVLHGLPVLDHVPLVLVLPHGEEGGGGAEGEGGLQEQEQDEEEEVDEVDGQLTPSIRHFRPPNWLFQFINPFHPDCKTVFSLPFFIFNYLFFYKFSGSFFNFKSLMVIAI